jgi:hypothetical protein
MAGKRIIVFSLFALAAVTLALFASSSTQAQSYKPSFTYTVANNTGGAASDTTNVIQILAPDYNYEDSSLYTFSPIDGSAVTGTEIPIADEVGTLAASVAVGLLGGPCSTPLPPSFVLENASIDTSDELDAAAMYWILKDSAIINVPYAAYNPAYPDYLEAYPFFLNDMLDPDTRAGALPPLQPRARYAGYTTVAGMHVIVQFIVLNPGQLTQLPEIKAQMGPEMGHPSLVVLDNPVSQEEAPGAISDFCTPLITTTTLLATTVANQYDATGGGITARVNPATDTGVLGTGTHMARNYSQGERDADGDAIENDLDPCRYTVDADGPGGIPDWDPRGVGGSVPGDADGDHLPDSCDPAPAISNIDEDGDGYNNGQDNCPLVPNGCNVASCSPSFPPIYNAAWDNQADDEGNEPNTDDGPGPDAIGNACDDSDDDGNEDGAGAGTCNDGIDNGPDGTTDGNDPDCVPFMDQNDASPWGTDPANGIFYHAMPASAVTINAAVDTDGDGYSDALEIALGSDETVTAETPESLVIDIDITAGATANPAPTAAQSCSDGLDNDGDTKFDAADNDALGCDTAVYGADTDYDGVPNDGTDNCPGIKNPEQTNLDGDSQGDACDPDDDNDGFNDDKEWSMGVDPLDDCSNVPGSHDAWPLDSNSDKNVTVVGDVLPYSGNIGASVGGSPPTSWSLRRLDLNADGSITVVGDVLPFSGNIGAGCV